MSQSFGDPGPDYGLWGRRVAAQIIDGVILIVAFLVFFLLLSLVSAVAFSGLSTEPTAEVDLTFLYLLGIFFYFLALIAGVVYAPILMARRGDHNGQTWGKQAMDIKVIRDPDQNPYGFWSAFVRQVLVVGLLLTVVPVVIASLIFVDSSGALLGYLPLLIDSLWPLWDRQNRALHDMIVNSRVIRVGPAVRKETEPSTVVRPEPEADRAAS